MKELLPGRTPHPEMHSGQREAGRQSANRSLRGAMSIDLK